jgi:hypothetical protein
LSPGKTPLPETIEVGKKNNRILTEIDYGRSLPGGLRKALWQRKASISPFVLRMAAEELKPIPSKGWAAMIRKVYEVDPMICSQCGGSMKVVAFLTDSAVVDRIIGHLKLTFAADKPPPPHIAYQEVLLAAETSAEYFS